MNGEVQAKGRGTMRVRPWTDRSSPSMIPRLHLVTDDAVLRGAGFAERARAVLEAHGPAVALHLRGHGLPAAELWALTSALAPVATATGSILLVNDRVDVAMAAGCAGVQLGRRSLPVGAARRLLGAEAVIGYSAHGVEEAVAAVEVGADYILAGTVYASSSHPGEAPAGVGWLGAVAREVALPVIAIGGISPARVGEVVRAGAHGAAVLSGVWAADDAVRAVERYLEPMEAAV